MAWDELASEDVINKSAEALKKHGFDVTVVENGEQAKNKVLEWIPKGAEVFTATSTTSDTIGLTKELNDSGNYNSIKKKFETMDREKQGVEMRKMGATPDWCVGSVHAVTKDGEAWIASGSGSQIPAYVYGATHVIWIVGTQKIVKNNEDAIKRVYEHSLLLESERMQRVHKAPGSHVSKLLMVEAERPGRIQLILVKEKLGF
jgi:hypothetical protein